MWFFRRSARIILSIGLAILFAVLSILRVPQIALSQVNRSLTSPMSIAGKPIENVEAQFRQRFICVTTSAELSLTPSDLTNDEQIRKKIVLPLAEKLEPCIKQNRDRVGTVDIKKLIGVTYTVDRTSAVVIVGIGNNSPGGTPIATKLPDPLGKTTTSNGSPENGLSIVIVNAQDIDGKPRQFGETFAVQIKAIDRNNNDISSNATLEDAQRNPVGRGATVSYTAPDRAKNECLTARVAADGQEAWYTACFTVSPKDIEIGKDVKVFDNPDEQDNLIVFDTESGVTCFRDDASLQKKLKEGDKVVPVFNPISTEPQILTGEILLPPVKLDRRISIEQLEVTEDFPKNAACFQSSIIRDWTEIVSKAEVSQSLPEFEYDDAPGFSRILDEDRTEIGFADIKEGWVEGVEENMVDLFRPDDPAADVKQLDRTTPKIAQSQDTRNCRTVINANGQEEVRCTIQQQTQEPTRKLGQEAFGNGNYSDTFPQDYSTRITIPLIDIPDQSEQTPGRRGSSQKPKCTKLSSQDQNLEFKATGFVGLKIKPNATGKIHSGLKNVKLNVSILKGRGATFTFNAKPTVEVVGGVTMDGKYNLVCQEEWLLYEMATPGLIWLGPTPFWIQIFFSLPLTLNARLDTTVDNAFVAVKIRGESEVTMKFDLLTGQILNPNDIKKIPSATTVSTAPLAGGKLKATGYVRLTLEPTFKFLIESLVGPAVGFAGNAQANIEGEVSSQQGVRTEASFTHWYQVKVKLEENGVLSKFDQYFSGAQSIGKTAKQVCTLDKVDLKPLFKSSLKEPDKEMLIARLSLRKGFNNVVNAAKQTVKTVKTVGKAIQQGKKQLEALPRTVSHEAGKLVPKEVKSDASKAKGWCTQIALSLIHI